MTTQEPILSAGDKAEVLIGDRWHECHVRAVDARVGWFGRECVVYDVRYLAGGEGTIYGNERIRRKP